MLRPSKHSHPDKTVIYISSIILSFMKRKTVVDYSDLLSHVKKYAPDTEILFIPTLNFLYIMGVIEYHPKIDAIEYLGKGV